MDKILLINPSYRNSYTGSLGQLVNPVFPILSLASLASVAKNLGYEVEIWDLSWRNYSAELFEQKINDFKPTIVGFTVLTPGINQVIDMSFALKEILPQSIAIAGGPHVSALPETTLKNSMLDIIVIGEGEITFQEVLEKKPLKTINGLTYREVNGEIRTTIPREPIKNLDTLPMPDWSVYDINSYKNKTTKLYAKHSPFVSLEFSRGCIYKCDFCASKLTMAFGYRKKSPKRCADEVLNLKKYGIKEFALTDDIFTTNINWAKEVCRELIKNNNKIKWSCTNGIRVESADLELFKLMKKAGCYRVAFGFESGNNEVLKRFGKGGKASIENAKTAVDLCHKAKLECMGFFLIGLSSDNVESIEDTIKFAKTLKLDLFKFGVTIAFPGTRMFNDYHKKGLIKSYNWDNYHLYSSESLFNHKSLKNDEIQELISKAYRETTFYSPRFILRKFITGLKTGFIFYEAMIFIKYLFISYTQQESHRFSYKYVDIKRIQNVNATTEEKIKAI